MPVRLALDGTCIALAEHWRGAAAGSRNALAMVVSTGVGGGLIVDGAPVRGFSGNAGHIGQLRLRARAEGAAVTDGTLESIASGPHTVAWARAQGWSGETGEQLAHAYAAADPVAVAAVRSLRPRRWARRSRASRPCSTSRSRSWRAGSSRSRPIISTWSGIAARDASVFAYAERVRVSASGLDGHGPLDRRRGTRAALTRAAAVEPHAGRTLDGGTRRDPMDTMAACRWMPPTC